MGKAGRRVLLYACVMLVGETRLALRSVVRQLEAATAPPLRSRTDGAP